jgi:hypothetical protein
MFAKRGAVGHQEKRVSAIVQLLQRFSAEKWTQQQWDGVWNQNDYTDREYAIALEEFKALQQMSRKTVVADPLLFVGGGEAPDPTLSSEMHQQGALISKVATQFKCSVEYMPGESRKSLRITRFVYRCVLPDDPNQKPPNASAIEGLMDNFVLYAGLHPNSSVVVLPGRIEIHQPNKSDDWVRPSFKRYVQTGLKIEGSSKQTHRAKSFSLHQDGDLLLHKEADGGVTEVPMDGLRYVMGVDLDDRPLLSEKFIGLLISGTTGSGKSQHLLSLVNQLMIRHHPKYLQFSLIDICGKTFFPYVDSPHLFHPPILSSDESSLVRAYASINKEIDDRDKDFTKHGIYDIEAWNARFPEEPKPRIVIMVEEHAETVTVMGRDLVNATLTRVGRIGRKLGVTVVICTQYVQVDDFKYGDQKSLLRNLGHRVVFKAADAVGSGNGFGNSSLTCATTLQGYGDGFTMMTGIPVRFQSLYLGKDRGVGIANAILNFTRLKYPEYGSKQAEPEEDDFWATPEIQPAHAQKSNAEIYQQYKKGLGRNLTKAETVRELFEEARDLPSEKLVGNTLNKYWSRLQVIIEEESKDA